MADILTPYLAAAYPAVAVETHEEERFLTSLLTQHGRPVLGIAAVGGLRQYVLEDVLDEETHRPVLDRDGRQVQKLVWTVLDEKATYPAAFPAAVKRTRPNQEVILVVLDWHHIARNAPAYRALKDALPAAKSNRTCFVLVAPSWTLPTELQHDVPVLQFALPSRSELAAGLDLVVQDAGLPALPQATREASLDAAAGLTLQEAESAFALSFAATGGIDARRVETEKMGLVRQSGYLEVSPVVPPNSVGGLGTLRRFLEDVVVPSWHHPVLRAKGILLLGPPGTGKSATAKMSGSILACPVLRCDIGKLMGRYIGDSEAGIRNALELAEAVSPCVLWLDEVEKHIGGMKSSAETDGGVTSRMVSSLLTWMQEHTKPIFVVATCNRYDLLPDEFVRRFDEKFFVDLPSASERHEIAGIHLRRYTQSADAMPAIGDFISESTPEWTGAEIEIAIKRAACLAIRQDGSGSTALPVVTEEHLQSVIRDIRPLSRTSADDIQKLREWGRTNLMVANTPESTTQTTSRRRLTPVG